MEIVPCVAFRQSISDRRKPGRDHSSIRAFKAHEDGIARFRREAGTGGRPHHSSVTQGTRGFPGRSRFTTSAPELGVADVFAEDAVEPQHEFARHSGDGHGGILFPFHQPEIKATQVRIAFAMYGSMRCFRHQTQEPIAFF